MRPRRYKARKHNAAGARRRALAPLWPALCFTAYFFLDFCVHIIYRGFGGVPLLAGARLTFAFAWSAVFTAAAALLPARARKLWMLASIAVFALLTLAHGILLNIFNRFFTFSDLGFADTGMAFVDLSYIRLPKRTLLAVLLAVLLMAGAAYLSPARGRITRACVLLSLAALAAGISAVAVTHNMQLRGSEVVHWEGSGSVYRDFTDSKQGLAMMGLYQFTARDVWRTVNPLGNSRRAALRGELDAHLSALAPPEENAYTGILAGRNLILIQLEAIDTWMLTEQAMPSLYALQKKSIDFTAHYSPSYITAGTFNTEFIVNTGLIPPASGVSAGVYAGNAYPYSLPALFRRAGYTANSFHGSPGTVYSRSAIHENWGYSKYYSGADMGMEDYTMDSQMRAGFDQMTAQEPFFSFVITYSGHGPYHAGISAGVHYDEMARLFPGADDVYLHAMAHARETDLFVGALLERLEATGLLENTVLVFYSDHYNYYVMNDALVMEYKGTPDRNLTQQTPFFIFAPDLAPQRVEKVTSSADILPTLLNLFAVPPGGAYFAGADVFGGGGGFVFFADGTWYDGTNYSAWGVPDADYARRMDEAAAAAARVSRDILLSDYYAK